jgi:hypothetical protein
MKRLLVPIIGLGVLAAVLVTGIILLLPAKPAPTEAKGPVSKSTSAQSWDERAVLSELDLAEAVGFPPEPPPSASAPASVPAATWTADDLEAYIRSACAPSVTTAHLEEMLRDAQGRILCIPAQVDDVRVFEGRARLRAAHPNCLSAPAYNKANWERLLSDPGCTSARFSAVIGAEISPELVKVLSKGQMVTMTGKIAIVSYGVWGVDSRCSVQLLMYKATVIAR